MQNISSSAAFADSKPHYELLDGLRGIAALLVIWYHIFEGFATSPIDQRFNHGYLAVDFFFILSGFVVGYAYDDRWKTTMSCLVENRRINRAYRIFPIYSKNKDQLGPFKGYISPFPRTSEPEPGTAGIKKRLRSNASITIDMLTCVPSHFSQPCIQNVIAPKTAPRITIGCKRINLRLKKSFVFIVVFQRSS